MEIFGRRTYFALASDALLYMLILWTTICYLLRNTRFGTVSATLFSVAVALPVLWLLWRRAVRNRKKLRERIRTELALKRLLLMDEQSAKQLFAPDEVLQKSTVQRDDLLEAIRQGISVLWLCGKPDADAHSLLHENGFLLSVRPKEQTAARIAKSVTDAEVEAEIDRRALRKKRLPPLREIVQSWKPNRFTLLGVLLMGLSFLTSQKLWFRLVASVCFVIGSLLYTRSIAAHARAER